MKTIYTAIIGPYEELKEPTIVTDGWKYICYTDQSNFKSNVWEIRNINCFNKGNSRFIARQVKLLFHKYVDTDASIWVDGSFIINCDLNKWWKENFEKEMTCIKHPIRDCIYAETKACVDLKRGDPVAILKQINTYTNIVPENNGLIQSGILMRTKAQGVIDLCIEWLNEIKKYSDRDQISFGKVSLNKKNIHYVEWNYQTGKEFIFKPHRKPL